MLQFTQNKLHIDVFFIKGPVSLSQMRGTGSNTGKVTSTDFRTIDFDTARLASGLEVGMEEAMSTNNQPGGQVNVNETPTLESPENDIEQSTSKKSILKKRPLIFVLVALGFVGLTLLIGLYYGSGFLVSKKLENQYSAADCSGMLNLARTAQKIYPVKLVPFVETAFAKVDECEVYNEAVGHYQQGDWEAAFQSYEDFLALYPDSTLANQARNDAAQALLNIAKELDKNEEFKAAIDRLTIILEDYKDTAQNHEAGEMLPMCYLKEGKRLMEQGFYQRAQASFYKAIEGDTNSEDASGPGAQANAILPILHIDWGKTYLKSDQYEVAIDHFEQAIELSEAEESSNAKDGLSAAYISWAEDKAVSEDFYAAVDKINEAKNIATSQAAKSKAEKAYIDILKAFSDSSGEQAEALMKEVAKTVCAGKKPDNILPIFGIQPSHRPVNFEGLWYPSTHLAETPGAVFYIACGEVDHKKIQSCPYVVSGGKTRYYIERRYTQWIFQLRDVKTSEIVAEKEFMGEVPDTCPARETFQVGNFTKYYDGPPPVGSVVDEWLESVLPETLSPSDIEIPDDGAISCHSDGGETGYVEFKSPLVNGYVLIDGQISSTDEWNDAFCMDMRHYEWGNFQDGKELRTRWWVQHDEESIYFLARVPNNLSLNGIAIDYFWPRYTGTWAHSDGIFTSLDGEFLDLSNWDESNWYEDRELSPPGSVDGEAATSKDEEYFWFEIKKALKSDDSYDWMLQPGQIIGYNPSDSFLFALIMEDSFFARNLQMELGKE